MVILLIPSSRRNKHLPCGAGALDASHLFPHSTNRLGFRPGLFLRQFHYDFIALFAPHLTRDLVDDAIAAASEQERSALFDVISLKHF